MTEVKPIPNIINSVKLITGLKPKTLDQCKAELMSYLRECKADDLIIEPDNIALMLELCHVHTSGIKYSEILNDKVITEIESLYEGSEVFERIGKVFDWTKSAKDTEIVNTLAKNVIKLHPDLHYQLITKKNYISFFDADGIIFEYGDLKKISNSNEMSGVIIFRRLKKKDYETIIQPHYLKIKTWEVTQGKDIITSTYYTFAELLDLITNRKIIIYGNYI